MPEPSQSWVTLKSGELSAQIDPHGAQLSVLKDRQSRDLLWSGDPAVWAGRAPILFPIVGMLAGGSYRLGAKSYPLARHGFARNKLFAIDSATSSSVVLRLSATEDTLKVYPFRFELEVRFDLTGPTLSMTAQVRNKGNEPMPASLGWHPGFQWPLPEGQARAAHFIQFEADEPDPVRRIDSAGLLKPGPVATPVVNRRLMLDDVLFRDDVIILDQVRSRSLIYGSDAGPCLHITFPDSPVLGIWTKPCAHFLCIEPWRGITDPQGYTGDFTHKPGVFVVAPAASASQTVSITLRTE